MRTTVLACFLALAPVSLPAQWSAGISLGIARYYGGAVSAVDSLPGEVHPYRPTTLTLLVGHDWNALRVDFGLSYGSPGLAAEIPGGAFVDTKGVEFVAAAPEVTVPLLHLGGGGTLRVGAGGDLTRWSIAGIDARVLLGGHVTAAYEWPVAGPFLGSIQAGVSLSPSLFRERELDPSFKGRSMLRPSLALGLRFRP